MPTLAVQLDLTLSPEWERIDPIREAVSRCLEATYTEEGLDDALGMVSAELLENAVKYGRSEAFGIRFTLRGKGSQLEVAVTNPTGDDPRHLEALLGRVAWLARFSDPAQAYLAALEELYERALPESASGGLGIVRIAHEGGCQVAVDTSQPGLVTVRASRSLA